MAPAVATVRVHVLGNKPPNTLEINSGHRETGRARGGGGHVTDSCDEMGEGRGDPRSRPSAGLVNVDPCHRSRP